MHKMIHFMMRNRVRRRRTTFQSKGRVTSLLFALVACVFIYSASFVWESITVGSIQTNISQKKKSEGKPSGLLKTRNYITHLMRFRMLQLQSWVSVLSGVDERQDMSTPSSVVMSKTMAQNRSHTGDTRPNFILVLFDDSGFA